MRWLSSTRRWSATFAALLVVAAVFWTQSNQANAQSASHEHALAIQVYPGLFINLLPWVAQAKGFYRAHDVKVTLVPLGNGPQGLAALEGGSIQLAQNNTDFMLLANAKGLKLQMVVGEWGQQFAFVARKGLTLPHLSEGYPAVMKDLVGDKVGVSARGAGTEYAMRAALSQAGVDPNSVRYVAVGGTTGQVPALRSGVVDVVVAPLEDGAVLQGMGVGTIIVDFQKGQGPQSFQRLSDCYEGFFGNQRWIERNGETLRRFVAAEKEAEAWARDPANLNELVSIGLANRPIPGVPDPRALAKGYLSSAQFQTKYDAACVANWNDLLVQVKLLQKPVPIADIVWAPDAK